jgi:uncharacterized protein DUF1839
MMLDVLSLDPATYRRHPIHGDGRVWAETNCYVDIWIELLHALGHQPIAALPFTVGIDFEGDQWTFFKFPLLDLRELYGLDVQELALWRPIVAHVEEQLARGRPVLVELDSFYLPDTAGTAYRTAHVKSTVAIVRIDAAARRLGYFHGQGYHELQGDDFLDALRLRDADDPGRLPPFAEFVKIRRTPPSDERELVEPSLRVLERHLEHAPQANPFSCFKQRLSDDLPHLLTGSLDVFHQYSFATLRQYGACYELSATYLRWLAEQGESGFEEPARAFAAIAEGGKTLQFQLARSVSRRKTLDLSPLDVMAEHWERGMAALHQQVGEA